MIHEKVILKKVGKRLRELRIQAGYSSYEDFAFTNEINRVQYWRLEKGESNFTIRSLITILNIHKLTLSEFFNDIGI